jgi:hypothetical protein
MKKLCLVLLVLLTSNVVQSQTPKVSYKDQPEINRLVGAVYHQLAVTSGFWVLSFNDKEVRDILAETMLLYSKAIEIKLNPDPINIKTLDQAMAALVEYDKLMSNKVKNEPLFVRHCYTIGMCEIDLYNMSKLYSCFPKDHKIPKTMFVNITIKIGFIRSSLRTIGASKTVEKSFLEIQSITEKVRTAKDTFMLKEKLLAFDNQFINMIAPDKKMVKR